MKLDKIDALISKSPYDFGVRFWAIRGSEGGLLPTAYNISELVKDWYDRAEYCPENDEVIHGLELFNDATGQVYIIDSCMTPRTFEDIMLKFNRIFDNDGKAFGHVGPGKSSHFRRGKFL